MSCALFEERLESLIAGSLAPSEAEAMRAHARGCADCAWRMEVLGALRAARPAFEVPEPHPAYWARLGREIERRTQASRAGSLARLGVAGIPARVGLAIGALAVVAVAAIVLLDAGRDADRPATDVVSGPAPGATMPADEEALVARIEQAGAERVYEALDEIAPQDPYVSLSAVAAAPSPFRSEEMAWAAPDDSPYEVFLALDEEGRGRLLEELRGELG